MRFLVTIAVSVFLTVGCDQTEDSQGGLIDPSSPVNGSGGAITGSRGANDGDGSIGGTAGENPDRSGEAGSSNTGGEGGFPAFPGSGGSAGQAGGNGGAEGIDPTMGALGSSCTDAADCLGNVCITDWTGGYCSRECDSTAECSGGSCWNLGDSSLCLLNCSTQDDCRVSDGYVCDADNTCYPGQQQGPVDPPSAGDNPVGASCTLDSDCEGPGNSCIPDPGEGSDQRWVDGYCIQRGCGENQPCPQGAECFRISDAGETACFDRCAGPADCREGYACDQNSVCWPGCGEDSPCPEGLVCAEDGNCVQPPCTPGSCPVGTICADNGRCQVDVGDVPPGPVPNCGGDDAWQCDSRRDGDCGALIQFEPINGPGYTNYPLNGETWADQYRSFARRDTIMLVQHAAAKTACLSQNWALGLDEPLGLGDMSEENGEIPGSRENQPGHPPGTHVDGFDMDIAYYQLRGRNNHLRSVCNHISNGRDQYHCVDAPDNLDVWRTALFLAHLHDSPQLRVIGVDGKIGVLVDSAIQQLCAARYLTGNACTPALREITYEVEDTNRGWFRFHHHHFHISLTTRQRAGLGAIRLPSDQKCLTSDCQDLPHFEDDPRTNHHHHQHPNFPLVKPIQGTQPE